MEISPERKLEIYRMMLLSRRLDERAWALHRQNKIAFHMSAIGHEAAQIAAGFALHKGEDWAAPYPRDLALMLALGFTPAGYFRMLMGKPNEMDAAGRQMPGSWSLPSANVISISGIAASHIPHAVGVAHALRLRRAPGAVLASCGEGATSMGEWYEAVNWAAVHRLPVVFLVQNNDFALSTRLNQQMVRSPSYKASGLGLPVQKVDGTDLFKVYEALDRMLEQARSGNGPGLVEAQVVRITPHSSDDDDRSYRTRDEVEEDLRRDPLRLLRKQLLREGVLTRELSATLDMEVKAQVEEAVQSAEDAEGPDTAAETSLVYAVGEPVSSEAAGSTEGDDLTLRGSINLALDHAMENDERVVLLGQDIGVKGGVFRVTEGLFEKYGPERVIDAPLSGAALVGVAIGMALNGLRPVCEIQFADFIHTAFNQIVNEAARMYYRSAGAWQVPLVIRTPYGGGVSGGLYHSQSIEAFFTHVPGLKVMAPSDPQHAAGLFQMALQDPNPVLFLEPKKGYRMSAPRCEGEEDAQAPGDVCITRHGEDVSILCYGMMYSYVMDAACRLAEEKISVEVLNLGVLQPLNLEPVLASARKTGKVLIVHEDNLSGGFGAELAARITEEVFIHLDAPVKRLAGPDVPGVPFNAALQDWFMVSSEKIMDAVRSLMQF